MNSVNVEFSRAAPQRNRHNSTTTTNQETMR